MGDNDYSVCLAALVLVVAHAAAVVAAVLWFKRSDTEACARIIAGMRGPGGDKDGSPMSSAGAETASSPRRGGPAAAVARGPGDPPGDLPTG